MHKILIFSVLIKTQATDTIDSQRNNLDLPKAPINFNNLDTYILNNNCSKDPNFDSDNIFELRPQEICFQVIKKNALKQNFKTRVFKVN